MGLSLQNNENNKEFVIFYLIAFGNYSLLLLVQEQQEGFANTFLV